MAVAQPITVPATGQKLRRDDNDAPLLPEPESIPPPGPPFEKDAVELLPLTARSLKSPFTRFALGRNCG